MAQAESSQATGREAGHDGAAGAAALLALNDWPTKELWERRDAVLAAFQACRARTLALAEPLSAEDMLLQSMPDASPTKWHLAHTSWFFETFILERFEPGFDWFDKTFCVLFNSYYNGIGEQHPRAQRGLVSRPGLARVMRYREAVEERIARLLACIDDADRGAEIVELMRLGINHEQQHQELIVTDLKHALAQNPAWPAYREADGAEPVATPATASGPMPVTGPGSRSVSKLPPPRWLSLPAGPARIGFEGEGFCYDNETPSHDALLGAVEVADRPVLCGEWLDFMDDGGYEDPALWLDEGWAWRREGGVTAPGYWRARDGRWFQFTLRGERAVRAHRPVAHVSYYEADAFARWAGVRLPTEAEWETAQRRHGLVEAAWSGDGDLARDEFHRNWEWTGSAYLPYPGFRPAPGAVGEYNGKFMVNQMVLRGAGAATPPGHARPSYRNFFPAHARWQYSGLRLARDVHPD